jgi:hypothetical protein
MTLVYSMTSICGYYTLMRAHTAQCVRKEVSEITLEDDEHLVHLQKLK